MKSVLYLGCPSNERALTEELLGAANVSVVWADTVLYALNELQHRNMPVLLDLSKGADALQIARDLRTEYSSTLMFAVVDPRRPDLTTEAVSTGIADIFARPLGGRRVASAIARELAYGSRGPATDSDTSGATLYSQSVSMQDVTERIARAAMLRAGVMIRGEESTGRQVAARAIHEAQTPANGAFVPLDCAAYDGDQLDMALFGVSARASGDDPGGRGLERVGSRSLLYEAQHGTLYLQHIVDAPSRVQARLARVLRDREAHLVDSGTTIALDVRPMAGADTTLECAVQEGHMRGDLFKRLSATQIDMPALRNRRDDIPALANHFVREICGSLRMPPKALSRPALTLLAALPWHGNADELRGLLQNIVTALPEGRGVGLEDVLAHVQLDGGPAYGVGGTLRQARAQFERDYITGVVVRHQGRISEAARVLGIQRTNLYRKMRLLKVSRDDRLSSYPPRAFPPGRQNS